VTEESSDLRRRWARWRHGLRDRPIANRVYRAGVGVVGVIVMCGVISFAPLLLVGLGILATEFEWAHRAMGPVRVRYDAVMAWRDRQPWWVRMLLTLLVVTIVIGAFWLAGVFGWGNKYLGWHLPAWLDSPLGLG
jgi:uncharacterized protein (TIGR02611 family)